MFYIVIAAGLAALRVRPWCPMASRYNILASGGTRGVRAQVSYTMTFGFELQAPHSYREPPGTLWL